MHELKVVLLSRVSNNTCMYKHSNDRLSFFFTLRPSSTQKLSRFTSNYNQIQVINHLTLSTSFQIHNSHQILNIDDSMEERK